MKKKSNDLWYLIGFIAFELVLITLIYLFRDKIFGDIIKLECAAYIVGIISNSFVMIGVIIALWQYIQSVHSNEETKKMEIDEYKRAGIQRAIDLAGYYKDEILTNALFLRILYSEMGVEEIMNKIDDSKIEIFDINEMQENIPKEKLNEIDKLKSSKKLLEVGLAIVTSFGRWDSCIENVQYIEDEKKGKSIEINPAKLNMCIQVDLEQTLNSLEYFAMHFTHGTADETVVYSSLHGSYLSLVKMLYYDIAKNNKNNTNKLYTNVIELYNIWRQRELEEQKNIREEKKQQITRNSGNKAKKY